MKINKVMTTEEAIKYLQQLYPNGGHCWLDEQRIEAISMAIKALQEEPVSNDLEEVSKQYALNKSPWEDCVPEVQDAFKAGAQWQKEQMEKEVDLEKEYKDFVEEDPVYNKLVNGIVGKAIAKHFFELGLKAQKGG